MDMLRGNYNMKFSQKMTLLICAFLLCFIVTIMLNTLILSITGVNSILYINLSIVTQNLLAFVLPVVITAAFISTKPLSFLQLDRMPTMKSLVFMLAVYVAMTPVMNYIVDWNAGISLPDSMSGLEEWMRTAENSAKAVTDRILGENNILLSILLVGILTGFSEEMLFRGGLQRILVSRPVNAHVAIWVTAFVFSAIHFQFFGFVPRLLIGAFCGYAAYWTGSLWTAVIAHALNNTTVIVATAVNSAFGCNLDNLGVVSDREFPILALVSLLMTVSLIYLYLKKRRNK